MEENTGHPETQAGETREPQEPKTLGAPQVNSTPDAFDGSNEQSKPEFSFDEVVFGDNQTGTKNMPEDTHGDTTGVTPQEQASPAQTEEQNQTESNTPDNDQVRYQYWQSQAQKAQNQLQQVQQQWGPTMQYLQQNPQAIANAQQAHSGTPVTEEPAQESFPDPPEKPTKPRGFSRAEAMEDSQSDSAKYLDEVDEWRDNIDEYNTLRAEYNSALVTEKMEAMEAEKMKQIENAKRAQAAQKQNVEINAHVKSNYQMNDSEAAEFLAWGNKPENLSMDNLVQLYRLQKGQGTPQTGGQVNPPSQNFEQVQRAQQVPSPMGVLSGQSSAPEPPKPAGDSLMDGLIGHTNKNSAF